MTVDVVLIHGAMHGAWCWERTVPHLLNNDRVRSVTAVDLPGHGKNIDVKPSDEITLDDYIDAVVAVVEQSDLRDVVLVGHSLGGITVTPAAHRLEGRLQRLVYLTTTNPPTGHNVMDVMFNDDRPEMAGGRDVPNMFCTDFDDDTVRWMLTQLGPQPPQPMTTPTVIDLPPAEVEAVYIVCERDEALTAPFQREQAARIEATVVSIDAGHSPFATHPEELAAKILD